MGLTKSEEKRCIAVLTVSGACAGCGALSSVRLTLRVKLSSGTAIVTMRSLSLSPIDLVCCGPRGRCQHSYSDIRNGVRVGEWLGATNGFLNSRGQGLLTTTCCCGFQSGSVSLSPIRVGGGVMGYLVSSLRTGRSVISSSTHPKVSEVRARARFLAERVSLGVEMAKKSGTKLGEQGSLFG